ncbi:MAG: hypothetical protein CME65_07865 [Halobacteriovoraceae bacterium]|nr:hypothetical protein [Halobacteriovoraceae bacterium]|tara:strand:+ start:1902 stop:3656 length:1755 start_codon:yes stop_codon:yes gene_type:complete
MSSKFTLAPEKIKENIEALQAFMQKEGMDYFYVSSFDAYLNEYVPMSDCHRFYFSNFTGSVAEVIVPQSGKVKLYVDGRYHEQADLECDLSLIDVVKVGANRGLLQELKSDLKEWQAKNIGLELDRTAFGFYKYLKENNIEIKGLYNNKLSEVISFEKAPNLPGVKALDAKYIGRSTKEKLELILDSDKEAHFVTAIDSLAWVANSRGYHIPFSSAFLGVGLLTKSRAYIFLDEGVSFESGDSSLEVFNLEGEKRIAKIKELQDKHKLDTVYFDAVMLNAQLAESLEKIFGTKALVEKPGGIIEWQSIKEEAELNAIRESFEKSDTAIFNTISWVKEKVKEGNNPSELDLYNETTTKYNEQGAVTQSFNTISGVDANGSIIHYGDPKPSISITEESMVLLDSGGYFNPGFATDTTRTFMGGMSEGSAKQKEIYTLTLKGTLNLQNAVFKSGTRGSGLDALARQPLYQAGYDYAHGTGHGVGIHVHEGGVGISPVRNYELKPGQVISIEPGIYIPGFAGVRIENIAIVVEHPEFEGFLKFEPLVYIGYEPLLIEESLLSAQEKKWLEEYELECEKRGRSFRKNIA